AYLEIAPALAPYFSTSHHDDEQGLAASYGLHGRSLGRWRGFQANTPTVIGTVDAAVAAAIVVLAVRATQAATGLVVAAGTVAFLVVWTALFLLERHTLDPLRRTTPRFPTPRPSLSRLPMGAMQRRSHERKAAPHADQSGAAQARRTTSQEPGEPGRRSDHPVRRVDAVRLSPHHLVRRLDSARGRALPLWAVDHDRVAGGHLPVDLRDDQPEPGRRKTPGPGRPPVADGPGRRTAERGAAAAVQPDPGAHQGHPRHEHRPAAHRPGQPTGHLAAPAAAQAGDRPPPTPKWVSHHGTEPHRTNEGVDP